MPLTERHYHSWQAGTLLKGICPTCQLLHAAGAETLTLLCLQGVYSNRLTPSNESLHFATSYQLIIAVEHNICTKQAEALFDMRCHLQCNEYIIS